MSLEGLIVVLFTDLVGSTELLGKLGEDDAERVRRIHFAEMRRAVEEHRGQEVKALGDGLMAVFRSALDALGCATAMQGAVQSHDLPGQVELEVRVGLHAGEPIRHEEDYFGTAVVLARRLCDAAAAGQILASDVVFGLVGSRSGQPFTPVGRLTLKGLTEPVAAYDVDWHGAHQGDGEGPRQPPRRHLQQGVLATRLIPPRPAPDALIRPALINRVLDGLRGRPVLVVAGAGYGKTTLLAQTLERLEQPWVWLSADERLRDPSLLVAHLAAGIGQRFPGFGARLDTHASPEDQLIGLCNEVQATIPDDFVLAIDDAHALSPAALEGLGQLLRDLPPQVHLILAGRPPLPGVLRRVRTGGTTELGPQDLALTLEDADALLEGRGKSLPRATLEELHATTGGRVAGVILASAGATATSASQEQPVTTDGIDRPSFRAREIHGRAAELAALGRLLDGAVQPAVLALVGEAGIGKTRLAEWAVGRAHGQGRFVMQGNSHLGLPEPLGVFCDAVRGIRRMGVEPASGDPLAAGFPERLLPELGARAGDPAAQGATFEAAVRYAQAIAADSGLLIVLEDLHWADPSSLTLAALLARTLASGPVAMIVTYRPDEDSGAAALDGFRRELRRMRAAELFLGPLAPDEAAAMLEELLGRRPEPDVEAELIRLSGGNPFALEELAQAVVDSGWIDLETGSRRSDAAVSVPWTLAESIRARSSRLAASERELLQWAAVIGEQFDIRLLAAAAGLGEDEVLAGLSGCVAAGLVVEDPSDPSGHRFAFRHALVHEALAQERLVVERARRHAAVLEAAERLAEQGLDVSASELARHAVAAGDRRRTVVHSRAAAGQAYEVGAIEEAVLHLERALERWAEEDGGALRADLLLGCGRLRLRFSRGDERAAELLGHAREAALELGDAGSAAVALALLADARFELGERERALKDWEQALSELREFGPAEAIPQALAGQARGLGLQDDTEGARAAADEGLRLLPMAADAEQARIRVGLLTTRGMVDLLRHRAEEARAFLLEAARLAVEHQDDLGAARAHHMLGANQTLTPPWESVGHFARAAELVRRHGLHGLEAWYVACQGWSAAGGGDWAAAARLADQAEGLIGEGERGAWTRLAIRAARADRLLGLGELDACRDELALLAKGGAEIGSPIHIDDSRVWMAGLAFLRGETTGLEAEVRPNVDALLEGRSGALETLELHRWLIIVELLVAADALADANAVAEAIRERFDSPWADYAQAVALAGDEAPDALAGRVEAACGALEATGFKLEPGRMRVAAGIVLSARPDGRRAAAALARTAHERFAALGSDAWCRRLEDRLRELGEPGLRHTGAGGGLTRRELEVLELLSEGLTNRAIAERLVISEATAIRHLANIYAKLGAHRRTEAVHIATERGLLGAAAHGQSAAQDT